MAGSTRGCGSPPPWNGSSRRARLSQTHAYWRGTARRSDGQLTVNNGTTALAVTQTDAGTLPVTLSNVAAGTRIAGVSGDLLVAFNLRVDGGPAWAGIGFNLIGSATILANGASELAKPSGFGMLSVVSVIRLPHATDGFTFSLTSNAALTMRAPAAIDIMRL